MRSLRASDPPRFRRPLLSLLVFSLLLPLAGSSTAATYRHVFSGVIDEALPDSPYEVAVPGAPFEIVFEHGDRFYEAEVTQTFPGNVTLLVGTQYRPELDPDSSPRRAVERWSVVISVGSDVITRWVDGPGAEIPAFGQDYEFVRERPDLLVRDDARERRRENGQVTQVPFDGIVLRGGYASIDLIDYGATWADDQSTMPTSYSLDDFSRNEVELLYHRLPGIPAVAARGTLTSISSTVIPEPSSALMIGLGLAALSRSRRGRTPIA